MRRNDDSVFASLQQVAGTRYNRSEYNRDILDTYLLRKAREKGIRLPTGDAPEEYKYLGAHVEVPSAGLNPNVVYIDVSSMYPSFILTLNASPETMIGTKTDLEQSQYDESDCVWGYIDTRPVKHLDPNEDWQGYCDGQYKIVYDPEAPETKWSCDEPPWSSRPTGSGPRFEKLYFLDHETEKGFLTECVEELIALKDQYRGTSLYGSTKRVTNCYKSDTSVVTSEGVENIKELDVGDEVYSINPETNTVEMKEVTDTFAYPEYDGELQHFQCQGVDLAVTPNHKMVVRKQHDEYNGDESYEFVEANEINNTSAHWLPHDWDYEHGGGIKTICLAEYVDDVQIHATPCDGGTSFRYNINAEMNYEGSYRKTYVMEYSEFQQHEADVRNHAVSLSVSRDEYARVPMEYTGNNIAEFIGWYVAEGSTIQMNSGSYEVRLTQMNDSGRKQICSLLEDMNIDYTVRGEKTVRFCSAVFAEFLDQECGSGSANKKLPEFVDNFDIEQKELMFEAMMAGDGYWSGEDSGRYTTKSDQLRDDVIQLMVELGNAPNYKKENGSWTIIFNSRNPTLRCSDWERVETEDGVYCVEVEDNHTLLAGRNGNFQFCGNSVYGVLGFATEDTSFRLFDWRLAEAITLCGRKMIQQSRDYVLEYLENNGYKDAYAALGDTDGVGISVPSAATQDEAMRVVTEAVESLNGEGYDEFFQSEMGVDPEHHHGEIEIESYAPQVFVPSMNPPHGEIGRKKRYIQWETWNDDDGECDDISITGLEAIRSDVAPITQDAQELFAETLRMDTSEAREHIFPQLREWAEQIQSGEIDLDYVCKRGGIGQPLSEYGSATRRASTFYRGSKYATNNFEDITIQQGDKPRLVHIEDVQGTTYPSIYDTETAEDGDPVDAVTVPQPNELPDDFVIDWETHWIKSLREPMRPLLETRFGGEVWDEILHQHEQVTLADL